MAPWCANLDPINTSGSHFAALPPLSLCSLGSALVSVLPRVVADGAEPMVFAKAPRLPIYGNTPEDKRADICQWRYDYVCTEMGGKLDLVGQGSKVFFGTVSVLFLKTRGCFDMLDCSVWPKGL